MTESSNPNRVLNVVPLRMISSDDVKATKPRMTHARRPEEGIRSKGAKPSSSSTKEELNKEGTRYVHNSIAKIVKRIMEENHQVPGISVPLQTIIPDPLKNISETEVAHTSGCDPAEEEINKDGQGGTNAVDLDEYSENELLASLNPSVAKRLMARRKGKAVFQSSPENNAKFKSPVKDSIKKRSTSACPIRSRAVAKSVGVGPSKCWSKVVPKKRKEREIVESESDVEVDVPDIPSRWKYVLQKRLAVERELTPNALENKEILELIQEARLLKTVCNLPKYEAQPELEVTDNKVCQVITTKQVKSWPLKEKLTARTKAKFDNATYIFDQTMKHAGSFSVKGPQ
ncbi:uncharacterized protein LOC131613455 [Vicia villosa]|uniref:uncharacterized protein LOC131613455 n=1 Tax=Vicia villosa TaxID=3911 RepID=UPI00273C81E7|nr:uncharacterized protein LOC131613455 [Vicia villosa]